MVSISRMPPPFRHHSQRQLASSEALQHVSEYLSGATTDPHLHPDSVLTMNGAQFSTQGSSGGVVLHNLRRLEAGLRGDIIFTSPTNNPLLAADDDDMPDIDDHTAMLTQPTPSSEVRAVEQQGIEEDRDENVDALERQAKVHDTNAEPAIQTESPSASTKSATQDKDSRKRSKKAKIRRQSP